VLAQHAPLAQHAGLTEAQIDSLRRGDEIDGFDEPQQIILRFVREAVTLADVSEETWNATAERHTPRELTELLVLTGFYRLMCTMMRASRIPTEDAIDKPWPDAPRSRYFQLPHCRPGQRW
jgi:alkylhydroperoxidase family enzyme